MAFCRNCGSEISEETKFCSNCGAAQEINSAETTQQSVYQQSVVQQNISQQSVAQSKEEPVTKLDKFGKFFGIILMILSFVDFQSDPALLTILLSSGIIAGCIFCFSKKYKLKGFTIVALILAVFCLLCGISQGRKIGFFAIPEDEKPINRVESTNMTTSQTGTTTNTESTTSTKSTTNTESIDPDLKAFLDSYEDFMDEYIEFMKSYSADPNNTINMLGQYTEIMTKYTEFAQKADAYKSTNMNNAELKYYTEVMLRVEQKLLGAM